MKNYFSKNKTLLIVIGVVAILAAVFGVGFYDTEASAGNEYQIEVAKEGNLSAQVGATGTVRAIQSATLTWQTSGIVESVNAGLGDTVRENDSLASLQKSSLPQNIILAEADLVSAEKALDDLLKSNTEAARAAIAVRDAEETLEKAQDYRDSINEPYEYDEIVYKDGKPEIKKRKVDEGDDETKANADRDLALAQAQYDDALRAYERLKDGPNAQDIAAAEARVEAARATLNEALIIAPFSGVITDASVLSGDQVAMGQMAFKLDDISHLQIDVEVSEVDINEVTIGQEVAINFDAVQNKEYLGEVVSVAGSGTEVSGSVNFKVTVELIDADELIKPGMTAAVLIQVRSIEDALLVPNRAVRVLDGKRVVYLLGEDGALSTVEVRLGATADIYSEVVGGDLEAGDKIVLNPPTEFSMPGPGGGGMSGGN
jgi:HlyD family secretion protein